MTEEQTRTQPYVVALGTAQDGGLPQLGSRTEHSERARHDARFRRLIASLLIVHPETGGRWLIDVTPDIREQTELANTHTPTRKREGARPPLYDGVFLTHAHMGHYTGLVHFGREGFSADQMPVFGTEQMCSFLRNNAPWSQLVELENVVLQPLAGEAVVSLAPGLGIRPIWVPHRGEYSDTVGFVIEGPNRRLLYIPDIDSWDAMDNPIEALIAQVDYALLDGTFYDGSELPGRDLSTIAHPFIADSLQRFALLPAEERKKVCLTHLNHTNPASNPNSVEAARVRDAGMCVVEEGQGFGV